MQISSSSQASLQCTARPRYLCSSQHSAGLHHPAVSPSYLLSCHTATWLRSVNKILETEKSSGPGLGRLENNFPPGKLGAFSHSFLQLWVFLDDRGTIKVSIDIKYINYKVWKVSITMLLVLSENFMLPPLSFYISFIFYTTENNGEISRSKNEAACENDSPFIQFRACQLSTHISSNQTWGVSFCRKKVNAHFQFLGKMK